MTLHEKLEYAERCLSPQFYDADLDDDPELCLGEHCFYKDSVDCKKLTIILPKNRSEDETK
jgi:hypothetical protein